ncbi:MAG: ribonuclease HII [Actinobacteria bacterium]|mgnify:CR=1 FL=1|nr:ribonuclease HII [Thermoleophilia bacterium]MCB9010806.1 ribonuclease HII [Actinomycetota bacterium]
MTPPRHQRRRGTPVSRRLFAYDRRIGVRFVAGADEAGRGCLAGPLVAAAVCLDLEGITAAQRRRLTDLDDSKRLDDAARQRLSAAIMAVARSVVILSASPSTIDRDGLHVTNLRLLRQALAGLEPGPDVALVDGFPLGDGSPPHTAVIGGDRRSACIAAASVVAKATRDRLMAGPADERHPGYGFARHVGYATETHRHAIRTLGPSRLHRRSFASPVYEGFGPEVGS